MRCAACKRELKADEPVYRVRVGYNSDWYRTFGSIGSVCSDCIKRLPDPKYAWSKNRWLGAKPCCHCQRPVFVDRERKHLRYFVFGDKCRIAINNAKAQEKGKRLKLRAYQQI